MNDLDIIDYEPTPQWGDLYLRFPDKETADDVLQLYPGSIDIIGTIHKRTGGTDDEPVMTALEGWHVNVRGPILADLTPYAVQPQNPVRVWA